MKASGDTGTRARGFVGIAVLALPLALYVALAARRLSAGVGYQMDEALYVESAVWVLRGGAAPPPFVHDPAFFVRVGGRQWPIMIFPYVGALKAWVALPLFELFGVSARTARASGVLLGALGIAGFVALIDGAAGHVPALLAGAALAIHPAYLDFTVFDHGGTSVWMGAMGLVGLALALHRRRRSAWSAFLLGLSAGIGVWGRANFLWFVLAALGAAAIAYRPFRLATLREIGAFGAGGLFGAAPLLVYELASRAGTLRAAAAVARPLTPGSVLARLGLASELMFSARQLRGIWGGPGTLRWEIAGGAVLLGLVAAAAVAPSSSDGQAARLRRALAFFALFLGALMIFSKLPIGQHHLAALLPPALGTLAILALELAVRSRRALVATAAAGLALAAAWLFWDFRIERGLRSTGGRGVWSSALADIGGHLSNRGIPPARLKLLDWGFQNNLYVVTGGKVHGTELFWGATPQASSRGLTWDAEVRDGGAFLLFTGTPQSPSARGFSEAMARSAADRTETVFRGREGVPVATLVEIGPQR